MTGSIEALASVLPHSSMYAATSREPSRACALQCPWGLYVVNTLLTPIVQNEGNHQEEPRVVVQSEDEPEKILLETRICKEDTFQKQQG